MKTDTKELAAELRDVAPMLLGANYKTATKAADRLEEMEETHKDYLCLAELLDGHDATECRANLVRLKADLAALTEDVGKCHDVLGEDRASDTSELWKFFETHKQLIARLRAREDDLEKERALADRLAGAIKQVASEFGREGDLHKALAAWKGARGDS